MTELLRPPPYSRKQIISLAEDLIRGYGKCVGKEFFSLGINFDVIFEECIYPEYEIDLDESRDLGIGADGEKVLGFYDPLNNRVFIDRGLKNDQRRVFTCWHEVGGHAILQGEWLRNEMHRTGITDGIATTTPMLSSGVNGTLEWQANLFAAHAAAPIGFVNYAIEKTFGLSRQYRYIGPGNYCIPLASSRPRKVASFYELCNCIAYYIQHWFGGLSVQALSYRVAESLWVVDMTKQTSPPPVFGLKRSAKTTEQWKSSNAIALSELVSQVR